MRKTSVYLSEEEAQGLRRVAAREAKSQAELIREGVQHYLANDVERIAEGQRRARERHDAEQQAAHDARLAAAAGNAAPAATEDAAKSESEARS